MEGFVTVYVYQSILEAISYGIKECATLQGMATRTNYPGSLPSHLHHKFSRVGPVHCCRVSKQALREVSDWLWNMSQKTTCSAKRRAYVTAYYQLSDALNIRY